MMIPFSEYMNEWLYGPGGYYATFKAIGKEGDFYTAVSSSRFFGATIAHYMISLIKDGRLSHNSSVVEIGAHQGYLLADIIEWIAQEAPELLKTLNFSIVERFKPLVEVQKEHFKSRFGEEIELVHYSDPRQIDQDEIFVVANEIFDSFPCDLIYKGKTAVVTRGERDVVDFTEQDSQVIEIAERYSQIKGEVARGYESFATTLFDAAKKIVFVSFDYGDKEVRNDFSVRIYKGHEVFPLFEDGVKLENLFGKSDITYDVNFSHVIDSFREAGFDLYAYKTQLRALTEYGLPDLLHMLAKLGNQTLYLRELNKVKTLIDPTIMGERFKLVEFHKNIG
ncbi:MAG: SAM-dependent methyltransferase [Hydrogenimonas sp.]|nr:SAM-dependent methyltransferase [Hydrogenimonas sp.]